VVVGSEAGTLGANDMGHERYGVIEQAEGRAVVISGHGLLAWVVFI
jgi:hypothetical protein